MRSFIILSLLFVAATCAPQILFPEDSPPQEDVADSDVETTTLKVSVRDDEATSSEQQEAATESESEQDVVVTTQNPQESSVEVDQVQVNSSEVTEDATTTESTGQLSSGEQTQEQEPAQNSQEAVTESTGTNASAEQIQSQTPAQNSQEAVTESTGTNASAEQIQQQKPAQNSQEQTVRDVANEIDVTIQNEEETNVVALNPDILALVDNSQQSPSSPAQAETARVDQPATVVIQKETSLVIEPSNSAEAKPAEGVVQTQVSVQQNEAQKQVESVSNVYENEVVSSQQQSQADSDDDETSLYIITNSNIPSKFRTEVSHLDYYSGDYNGKVNLGLDDNDVDFIRGTRFKLDKFKKIKKLKKKGLPILATIITILALTGTITPETLTAIIEAVAESLPPESGGIDSNRVSVTDIIDATNIRTVDRTAEVIFKGPDVSGELFFIDNRNDPESEPATVIAGTLESLGTAAYHIRVYNGAEDCNSLGPDFTRSSTNDKITQDDINGDSLVFLTDPGMPLNGPNSIIGRPVVIYSDEQDEVAACAISHLYGERAATAAAGNTAAGNAAASNAATDTTADEETDSFLDI